MIAQTWSLVSHLLPLGGTLIALGTNPPGTVVWSEDIHRTICEIAWRELTAESRRHIRELLSEDHEYSTFADACAWADRVRRSARYIEYRTEAA